MPDQNARVAVIHQVHITQHSFHKLLFLENDSFYFIFLENDSFYFLFYFIFGHTTQLAGP